MANNSLRAEDYNTENQASIFSGYRTLGPTPDAPHCSRSIVIYTSW